MNFGSLSRCACFLGNVGAILYGCPFAVAKGQSRKGIAPTLPQKLTLKHERGKLQMQHKRRNWYNNRTFSYQIKKRLTY
jgi:hypothetical protein